MVNVTPSPPATFRGFPAVTGLRAIGGDHVPLDYARVCVQTAAVLPGREHRRTRWSVFPRARHTRPRLSFAPYRRLVRRCSDTHGRSARSNSSTTMASSWAVAPRRYASAPHPCHAGGNRDILLRARSAGLNPANATGLVFAAYPYALGAKGSRRVAAMGYHHRCRATRHDFCPNDSSPAPGWRCSCSGSSTWPGRILDHHALTVR